MAERHAFGLDALETMTGKLLQATYLRAARSGDPEDRDRAILLFDRLARGYRLTLALEARMDRDRSRQAAGVPLATPAAEPDAGLPSPAAVAARDRPARRPREGDYEDDIDLGSSDLPGYVGDLRRMVIEDADILDSDGTHAETLERWTGAMDGDTVDAGPNTAGQGLARAIEPALTRPSLKRPPRRSPAKPPRRASG